MTKYRYYATYDGTSPWTNAGILQNDIDNGPGFWDISYQAGVQSYNCCKRKNWENWAAVVDNTNFGLGIYTEDTRFTDFTYVIEHGSNNGSGFSLNGKFFCNNGNCLQGTDTFEYTYIIGNLSEIRDYAYNRHFTPSCACNVRTSTSQITEENSNNDNLTLYPNPTSYQTELELKIDKEAFADIYILNSQGYTVKILKQQLKKGKNNIGIDMNDLKEGTYIARIVYDGKSISKTFVITNK